MHKILILISFLLFIPYCKKTQKENQSFDVAIQKFKNQENDRLESPEKKLPYLLMKNFDPSWNENSKDLAIVQPFSFRNQDNQIVTQKKIEGKITIISYFYTRCNGFCPKTMSNFRKIQTRLSKDSPYMISFSVTPDLDTPKVLNAYSNSTGFGKENWDLLTGDKVELYKYAREVFKADTKTSEQKSQDDFIHSEQIFLIDPQKRIRGIYNGNINGDIERLIQHILILKQLG